MSAGAAELRPPAESAPLRGLATTAGIVVLVLATVPVAGHDEVVATLRFAALAMVAPALLVLGAPWHVLGRVSSWSTGALGRIDARRRAHRGAARLAGILAVDVAVMVAWRTPVLVDAVARTPVLELVASATLVAAGVALWLELVVSPPFAPRATRPGRATLAALAMWSVWVVAYLEAMSHTGLYDAFRHTAGSGLSSVADRQLSAAILWAVSAAAFMPVVFWNLFEWLTAEGSRSDDRATELAGTRLAQRSAPDAASPDYG